MQGCTRPWQGKEWQGPQNLCLTGLHPLESWAWLILSQAGKHEVPQKRLPLNIYPVHFWTCLHRSESGSSRSTQGM